MVSLAGFLVIMAILAIIFWRQIGFIVGSLFKIFVGNIFFALAFGIGLTSLLIGSFFNPWGWPLTILVLFTTFTKFYEWIDDRFLDEKIGGWIVSQKYTFVQIIPNINSDATIGQMEKFLVAISSVYGNRTQKDFRTSGKFYDEFTFEIHSDGGKVAMYVRMNKDSSLPVFMTAAQTHFPKVQFVEVANPCENWPEKWQEMNKKYQHLIGAELTFPGSDLFPTKNVTDLQRENTENQLVKDPFLVLVKSLEQVNPEDYVVIQFICRPFDHAKVVGKKWKTQLASLKKELANNAEVARGKGGLIQPYTLQEENLINSCEQKMSNVNFHVKARAVLFGAKITSKRYLPGLMGYLKIFYTDRQVIIPKEKTWDESDNATWGPFWDKLYWAPEQEKRRREMYLALIKRSGGRGGDKNFWDVRSLAAIFHIPNTNFTRGVLSSEFLQTGAAISDVDYNNKTVKLIENALQNDSEINKGNTSKLTLTNSLEVEQYHQNLNAQPNSQQGQDFNQQNQPINSETFQNRQASSENFISNSSGQSNNPPNYPTNQTWQGTSRPILQKSNQRHFEPIYDNPENFNQNYNNNQRGMQQQNIPNTVKPPQNQNNPTQGHSQNKINQNHYNPEPQTFEIPN